MMSQLREAGQDVGDQRVQSGYGTKRREEDITHRMVAVAALFVFAVACGGDTEGAQAFCEAARDADAVEPGDVDATLEVFRRLRDEAPDEISDAMNTLFAATEEAFETRDPSIVQREEVIAASAELDAYVEDNCEPPDS